MPPGWDPDDAAAPQAPVGHSGKGTWIVAHYRLYFLDQADHIRHAISLECDDDSQALAVVEERRDGRTIELWQGARRVARLEAE